MKCCPSCKRRIDEHIISNLYICRTCGYQLLNDENSNTLEWTDLRKLVLKWDGGWNTIYSYVYQLDLLKIRGMALALGIPKYALWVEKVIKQIDSLEKKNTDFRRVNKLPRIFLKDYLDERK